ncbi:MAG: flagellar hook-associated protein FlgK [Methylococcaceae bacterium TMED69]|nr:MAG: flagellar hook-associated protein FlgK [Methylococcaceae bacterium TMED69]
MSDLLSIGSGAAHLYRQALATVSNNIANLNTEGYSRQDVSMAENNPSQKGTIYLGTGARVTGISRAYDEFVETSLRNSGSEYSTQEPIIQYAKQVVDLIGSEASGLSSVLDKFFSSAHQLTVDPASTSLRTIFLRDTESVADRFKELSNQLDTIDQNAKSNIEYQVESVNNLAEKILAVNTQLARKTDVALQSPTLLDQRDKLLRDLSSVAKINVIEKPSGQVVVSLDGSNSQATIVREDSSTDIGVSFIPGDLSRADLIYDPFGDSRPISNVSSGTLAGLVNFRSQILSPAMDGLDNLARVLTKEVNEIHTSGIDAKNQRGGELFEIEPVFNITSPTISGMVELDITVEKAEDYDFLPFEIRWIESSGSWRLEDEVEGDVLFIEQGSETEIYYKGLSIAFDGDKKDGDTFFIRPIARPAAGLNALIKDPNLVATAARIRVTENIQNVSNSQAELSFSSSTEPGFDNGLSILELNHNSETQSRLLQDVGTVEASNLAPIYNIPSLSGNVTITIDADYGSDLNLQMLNRDSNHLLGTSITESLQQSLVSQDSGFNKDSYYSDAYLNKARSDGSYLDSDMTYGFLANSGSRVELVADSNSGVEGAALGLISKTVDYNAEVSSDIVYHATTTTGTPITLLSAGDIFLNGTNLGELVLDGSSDTETDAKFFADYLNAQTNNTGVNVSSSNHIEIASSDINLLDQVEINGQLIGGGVIPNNINELVQQLNDQSDLTNVSASVSRDGGIILTNTAGNEGKNIQISNPDNTATSNSLGLANKTYTGTLLMESSDKIRFTIGNGGSAGDLKLFGLKTGIYINSNIDEELAVFLSGTGTTTAAVGYAKIESEEKAERPYVVEFLSPSKYQIIDSTTDSVVATRVYEHSAGIEYQNLLLSFNEPPQTGDTFTIDNNDNATGDNANISLIASLRNQNIINDEKSINEAYLDIVNVAGTKATLAEVSKAALKVVFDQASQAREDKAGVSLDEEAADLIRFQQAYQASAQVIQVSSKIFEAILGVG